MNMAWLLEALATAILERNDGPTSSSYDAMNLRLPGSFESDNR